MTGEQQSDTVLVSERMQKIASFIQDEITKATGGRNYPFALTVFTPEAANFISNGPKESIQHDLEKVLTVLKRSKRAEAQSED